MRCLWNSRVETELCKDRQQTRTCMGQKNGHALSEAKRCCTHTHTPLISVQFFVVAVPVCMLPAEVCLALCMAAVQLVDSAGIQVTKSQLSSQQQTCKRRKRVETVSDKEWKRHQRLELILDDFGRSNMHTGIPHTYMAGLWIVIELSAILI